MSQYRIKTTGEVVTQGDLRRMYPNTSFPRVWDQNVLDFLGVDPVFASPQPTNTDPLKTVRRNGVVQDSKGNWVENYEIVDMFADTADAEGNVITKAEQETAFLAKRAADQWAIVRTTRDNLLKETDWTQVDDVPFDNVKKAQWAIYRQALRDVPTQADPFNVTWPVKPE